jgi:hypothetical protein
MMLTVGTGRRSQKIRYWMTHRIAEPECPPDLETSTGRILHQRMRETFHLGQARQDGHAARARGVETRALPPAPWHDMVPAG